MTIANNRAEEHMDTMRMMPTVVDLLNYARSSKSRSDFTEMSEADRERVRNVYTARMQEVSMFYKLQHLDGVPLRIDDVEICVNEDRSRYATFTGVRLDTDEPILMRTQQTELLNYASNCDLPDRVTFIRLDPRRMRGAAADGMRAVWLTRFLTPLTRIDPWRNV